MNSVFEEIASRIDYFALYSEYLRVRRRGNRLIALCPFHQEKEPSLNIDPATGLWHCFGCKEGGNVFQFISRIEGLEMRDVVEFLARKYRVDLSKYRGRETREKLTRRQYLLKVISSAAKFYANELHSSTHGQKALAYLKDRGLTDSTIRRYGLGVTPREPNGLTNFLLQKNVKRETLEELSLSIASRASSEMVDFFRNRIIFPLFNIRGEVVSFAGRVLTDGEPKYLNTANTPLYNKSRLLYGINFARKAITEMDQALVVEGYMDVLLLHQAGIMNAVATCGTALSSEHIREIGRYTDNFLLAFDGDSAGINAALNAGAECLAQGYFPRIMLFREGKDPADVVKEGGKEAFEKFKSFGICLSVPRLLVGIRIKTREPDEQELKKLFAEADRIFRVIPDPLTAQAFARELADALNLSERQVRDILSKKSGRVSFSARAIPLADKLGKPVESLYLGLFSLLIKDKKNLSIARKSSLTAEDFPEGVVRDSWVMLVVNGKSFASEELPDSVKSFLGRASAFAPSWDNLDTYIRGIKRLKLQQLSEELRIKKKELTRAVEEKSQGSAERLRAEMQALLERQKAIRAELSAGSRGNG